jgi:hypothetical protein
MASNYVKSDLEKRLDTKFPECIKSVSIMRLELTDSENGKVVADSGEIKVISIINPSENYTHIGIVVEQVTNQLVEFLVPLIDEFKSKHEFAKMKYTFRDIDHPGLERKETDFVFTRKVYVITRTLSADFDKRLGIEKLMKQGYFLEVEDDVLYKRIGEGRNPDIFICHDSRDKDLAEKLYFDLSSRRLKVWLDKFEMKVGDSLTQKIQEGISKATYGIVILSKHFLSNKTWVEFELKSILTKEIVGSKKVILPIWHDILVADLKDANLYYLLDKFALRSDIGVEGLGTQIFNIVDEQRKEESKRSKRGDTP